MVTGSGVLPDGLGVMPLDTGPPELPWLKARDVLPEFLRLGGIGGLVDMYAVHDPVKGRARDGQEAQKEPD